MVNLLITLKLLSIFKNYNFEISNYDMISVRKIIVVLVSLFLLMFGTNVIAGIISIWFVHLLI